MGGACLAALRAHCILECAANAGGAPAGAGNALELALAALRTAAGRSTATAAVPLSRGAGEVARLAADGTSLIVKLALCTVDARRLSDTIMVSASGAVFATVRTASRFKGTVHAERAGS